MTYVKSIKERFATPVKCKQDGCEVELTPQQYAYSPYCIKHDRERRIKKLKDFYNHIRQVV